VLGYTKHSTAENTEYGDFAVYAGDEILGRNGAVDYFYKFWHSLEKPSRKDIRPSDLTQYLEHLVLMDVQNSDGDFALHVRLIGTFVASYYGEISGKDVREMANKQAIDRIYYAAGQVLKKSEPLLTVAPGFAADKQYLEAYALYMPLYDAKGEIEKIMAAIDIVSLNAKPL